MAAKDLILDEKVNVKLPAGFTAQPLNLDEVEPVVDLCNTYGLQYLGIKTENAEDDRAYWQTPGFNVATDTLVVRSPQAEVVGFAEFWDVVEPHTRFNTYGVVHPNFEQRGLGTSLLDWIQQRAWQELPKAPEGARVVINQGADTHEIRAIEFLEQHGFQKARQYYMMQIELDAPPSAPVLPAGVEIRPYRGEAERTEMIRVIWEAFHDHWGFVEEPFENYHQRMLHWAENLKGADPTLWFVALVNGRIAGSCLCVPTRPEDPEMAWVNQLGVLRDYRKQGLGMALLKYSFGEFYRRGKKRAGLGVDAGSLTGAVRLYENAGMHAERVMVSYHKVLRDGKDLSVQSL